LQKPKTTPSPDYIKGYPLVDIKLDIIYSVEYVTNKLSLADLAKPAKQLLGNL
jgi:hypothetical protein